ncbi:hypothetical protein O181_042030 [Austropuccinia psidii MF-1]|uniref:CCHC-type domain-containing protein n=1 Tax=Austropuccinia psidii MF-1 TaxID=1389203 RepID=A0A9Q3HHR4_9BASI|nr:hypothetical protein [Austropuccinia psidii MF-1]
MSPSPARSKPAPPQLSLLMNPLPDPPDKNNHMISPQIYKDEPGFFNQASSQTDATTLILKKINALENKLSQRNLPRELTTILNKLCKKIESLTERQKETDKTIRTILSRLDNLEKQPTDTTTTDVSTTPHPVNRTNTAPFSYAEAIMTNPPRSTHQLPKKPTFIPPNLLPLEQNKFTKFSIVIRTKFGATKPFKGKTTQESYNRVNKALMEVNAKYDNVPIRIRAIIKYPSGDIRLFTKTKAEAKWLLENRATWTHLADPFFVMSPLSHPVIAHSCPTFIDFEDDICRNAFLQQNEIEANKVLRIRWLGHPKEEEKSHGSIVIQLTDKTTAQQLLQGGLIFDGTFMQTMPYTPGPHQCFNCLKTGHQAYQCRDDPTCIKCGGKHTTQSCLDSSYVPSVKRCVRCINEDIQRNGNTDKYEDKYRHSCLSQRCPIQQKEIQRLVAITLNHGE